MSGVLKLIEKQRAIWEMRGRLKNTDSRPGRFTDNGISYGPSLLISRQCGSGGLEVARLTGERLGWEIYDREIVDKIAHLANARENLVESVDEKVRTRWESAWRPMINSEDVGCEAYLCYLRQVVLTLGRHGDVVIVGRGAQYILPLKGALRVRLTAPLEQRIKRIAEIRNINREQAEAWVHERDKERDGFIRKNFHIDPASPLNYDLFINTGEIPHQAAAEIVLSTLQAKFGIQLP
jgi:cytidylate kinase